MRETAFTRAAKWQRIQFYKSTSCSLFCFFTTILSLLDEGIKALENSFGYFCFWKERCLNHPCSCCLCLASLPQCPQAQMVMVPPSLIKKDRGEDYTVSNEKAPNRIHICIWRKSNVASPLWGDWFWLCPTFIQCTMQGTQKRKKLRSQWEKNMMQLCFTKILFYWKCICTCTSYNTQRKSMIISLFAETVLKLISLFEFSRSHLNYLKGAEKGRTLVQDTQFQEF